MNADNTFTPEKLREPDALTDFAKDGCSFYIPLAEGSTLPTVEGPSHRRSIKALAASTVRNLELERAARTDPLTGLANREAFRQELDNWIGRAEQESDFAVLFIDLDNFKQANDELGHDKGDDVLLKVASTLDVHLREGEMLARLGGDEFVAIIDLRCDGGNDRLRRHPAAGPQEVIDGLIDRLRREVSAAAGELNAPFVGASIGAAMYLPGESPGDILKRADQAMYRAKEESKRA